MAGWSRDVSFRFLCTSLARMGATLAVYVPPKDRPQWEGSYPNILVTSDWAEAQGLGALKLEQYGVDQLYPNGGQRTVFYFKSPKDFEFRVGVVADFRDLLERFNRR